MRLFSPVFCFIVSISISACSREEVVIEESAVAAKIDSIVAVRKAEVTRRAAEDLEQRSAIEVKVKTDSILAARAGGDAPVSTPPAADREP